MESIVKNTLVVKLVLNATEAALLKSLAQNSHHDEPDDVRKLKEDIFNAIPEYQELHNAED